MVTVGDFNSDGVADAAAVGTITALFTANTINGVQPLLPFSLKYLHEARQALSLFSDKLNQLGKHRGQIGAFQSRLNTAINVLSPTRENYLTASSRIKDADIAAESSTLIREQIKQSAAAAVLAQANLQPDIALSLLK